jgi:hypothetical protein
MFSAKADYPVTGTTCPTCVIGPTSATANSIALFNGTTGKLLTGLSSATISNTGQLTLNTFDTTARDRGPLFILNDAHSSGNPAGKNMGCQFWVGSNPTATPGAGDAVNCTFYIDNNNRTPTIGGINIVTIVNDLGAGWTDIKSVGMEVEVSNLFTANSGSDPFGSSATRKNGIEIINGTGTIGRTTAGLLTWAVETNGGGWFDTAIATSRAYNYGFRCVADPGGITDTTAAFKTACISDESDSVSVLKVSRTHTSIINLAAGPTFGAFILGKSAADTSLLMTNLADHIMAVNIDSGSASANLSVLTLSDRQAAKWSFIKETSNDLTLTNQSLSSQAASFAIATNKATFNGVVAITNTGVSSTLGDWGVGTTAGSALGITRAVHVVAASGTAGVEMGVTGVNTSAFFFGTDGTQGSIATTGGAFPLFFLTNTVNRLTIMGNATHFAPSGTAPALTSCGGGSPAITGTDVAGEVTTGTTATGCVITFNVAYVSAPYCAVSWQATPLASQSYSVSNTAITLVQTSTSSNKINYTCMAQSGG